MEIAEVWARVGIVAGVSQNGAGLAHPGGTARMRKINFIAGAGMGFVLGSKVGSGPYRRLESVVRKVADREDVKEAITQAQTATREHVDTVTRTVGARLRPSSGSTQPSSYVDPQDLQFSKAAAEKEETLDVLLDQGVTLQELDEQEEALRQSGELAQPRAGNKAPPSGDG
jgi:hypothetical protein